MCQAQTAEPDKPFFAKKGLNFSVRFVIIPTQLTQGSYIGNTTASQAVKAGSIPVPCSNKKVSFVYRTNETFWMMFAFGKWCRYANDDGYRLMMSLR